MVSRRTCWLPLPVPWEGSVLHTMRRPKSLSATWAERREAKERVVMAIRVWLRVAWR